MLEKIKEGLLMGEHTCPWWLAYAWDNRIRRRLHDTDVILKPYLRSGMTTLDVGCGMGYFSLHMASYVGEAGRVIAVDIQPEMLGILRQRSKQRNLERIITPFLSQGDLAGIDEKIDFALNFWMLHEVRSRETLVRQIFDRLTPGGRYLIAEPRLHTGREYFTSVVKLCESVGFRVDSHPRIWFSRAVVMVKQALPDAPPGSLPGVQSGTHP